MQLEVFGTSRQVYGTPFQLYCHFGMKGRRKRKSDTLRMEGGKEGDWGTERDIISLRVHFEIVLWHESECSGEGFSRRQKGLGGPGTCHVRTKMPPHKNTQKCSQIAWLIVVTNWRGSKIIKFFFADVQCEWTPFQRGRATRTWEGSQRGSR